MKNRINDTFKALNGEKAMIAFITGGDPDIETTKALIREMAERGADVIEIGVPFSDPIAEGPVIQAANERALGAGVTMEHIFTCVKEIRGFTQVPIVFLLYFNSILQYEPALFFKKCEECGVDGVIVPDLPYEEKEEIAAFAERHQIIHIALVAPTSDDRIEKLVQDAQGFVYCVSSLGVTGMRNRFRPDLQAFMEKVKRLTDTPACIGFGISNAEQAAVMKPFCDGVIIGSAIVNIVAKPTAKEEKIKEAGAFVESVKRALTASKEIPKK